MADYGVAVDTARWTIDTAATAKAREEIRRVRGWSEVPKVQWHDPLTPGHGAVRAAE
jgi:N-methylhydantoinase B